MKSNEYLNAVKEAKDIKTDKDLADYLDTSKQAISNIRKFRNGVRGRMILRVAKSLKMPVEKVTFEMLAEGESNPEAKKEFLNIAAKFSVILTISLSLIGILYPTDSYSNIDKGANEKKVDQVVIIRSNGYYRI